MREFHIHIDALTLSPGFEEYLRAMGFSRRDFATSRLYASQFVPKNHLTRKIWNSDEFKRIYQSTIEYVNTNRAMKGYIEGEFVALDKCIERRPFNSSIRPPLLLTDKRQGRFRESEIHISLNKKDSDPRLLQSLTDMGLHTAYLVTPSTITQVFTAQGTREQIKAVTSNMVEYLEQVGGASNCSVKEERTVKMWISGPDILLPPIIDSIQYL